MAVIEGYTFAVDMQDRGVVASLRQMRSAASAMKAEMRAGFEAIRQGEGSISAYNFKIEQSERQIENYKNMQKELRDELEKLSKAREKQIEETKKYADTNSEEAQKVQRAFDETEKKYASTVRQIENAQHQINKLTQGIEESRKSILQFNTGLARTRTEAQSVKSVMDGYVRSVNSQGNAFRTAKAQVESYKLQHGALINQFRAEVSETNRLQSKVNGLRNSYSQQQAKVNQTVREHGKASSEYRKEAAALVGLSEKITNANSEYAKQITQALKVRTSINEISRAERSVTDGGISRLSRAMNNLDTNARRATSHTREWAQSLRGGIMTASMALVPFGAAVGKSVQMSANLQQSWVTTGNLLKFGAKSASEAASEVRKVGTMQRDAAKFSKEYGYSQKDIADQYTELVKRGYSAGQSIGSMKSMLEAARASGDDYGDVVQNVSNVLDAFNLRQGKTSEQVIQNSKRVTNAMAYAADMTATDFKNMGEAMHYVSASASQSGQSIETTTAALGELSNAGLEGSIAGTGLRKVLNSLLSPTAGATEALKKYGMTMDDFKTKKGALKQLPDIMKVINKHTENLSKADRGAFFKAVFGTTGQNAAMILSQSANAMDDLIQKEEKAEKTNYVHQLAQRNMQSTKMQMQQLKMNIQDIAINLGNKLLPAVNDVAKAMSNWVGSKDGQRAIGDFSKSVSNFARVISHNSKSIFSFTGGFVEGFTEVFKISGIVVHAIGAVGEAIGLLTKNVEKALGIRQRNINFPKYLGEVTGGVIGLVTAFKILKGTVNGLSALKQDFLSLFRINKENDKIKLENHELERNVALWKEHNLVSGGDSAIGNSIEIPSKEKGATSKIEKVERDVQIRPYLDETRSSRISRWFSNDLSDFGKKGGEKAGAKASTGFLSKFKSLPNLIKKAGIFGSIIDFGMVALTALDLSKNIYSGLTNSKAKSRYKDAGKSMAEGIGWYLAGPFGGQLASLGTDWAYKTTDSFKKGWNGYTKNYKPRGFVATVGWDFKDATRKYNNWIATIEKKHPVIAGYFRWERGTFNTAFATLKFFARNVHAGLKEMWDTIADLGTLNVKRWKSDMGRDARSMIKGVKDDWRGFFDWFGKNRQKETIHKPTRKQSVSSTTDTHKSTSENKVKSLGNTRYSKSDVQNLKAMTAQIGSYEKALKGLKGVIKTNDPTSELRHMNSELKGASSNWGKVAKPIKEIGDAFKYLSRFTNSMAKKDAFAAFNDDLPKLDGTVKKYGKSLIKNIDSLGKSLKNNSLEKPLKKISSEIKDSTKKWKEFASPVKSLSKSFKTLQNATKTLVGKNGLEATKKGFTDLNNALKKQKIGAYIKKLAGDLKKSKVTTYLTRMDKSVKNSAKYWRSLAKPLKSLAGSFNTLQKSVRGLNGKKTGFTALNSDIRNLYRTIRKNPFGRLIAQQANIANKAMSGKKSGFVNEFNRQTRSMDRALRSFKREFDRDWRSTWSGLDRPVSRNLGSASRSVDRYLDDIQSTRSKFSSSFLKGWDSWIDDVVSNFRKGFDKLPGYAQSSMKDIISRLNKGISGINSTISNFGGDKKLSTISYANGTNGGHPGGHMLVNDSVRPHWKELVLFPNGQALLPQHRNTLIPNAPRGTQVLSGESTYKFMNSIGVHKYANGTLSESEMDKLSEQFEKHPEEAAKTLILKMTNWNSRVPLVADLGPASAIAFAKAISNVLKDQMASEANPGGAGVARWRPYIIRAFHALGYDAAEWKVNKLLKQIETESGGNPTIPQQVHDKNSGGNESLGLLQFALSTWNADALPGHKNRASGYDQILAAINVLEHGGEGGWGNVGMGHGWATGGFATKHGLYEVAEEGLPEAIIPLDVNKRPRALSLIDHTLDKMEQDSGGTGGLRSRRVQSQSNDETTAYLKQAVTFLAQIVGLNKQQIDAILANGSDNISARRKRAQFYSSYGKDQKLNDYMSY